jgi:hypothetical protein
MNIHRLLPLAIMLCAGPAAAQTAPSTSGMSTSTPMSNAKPFRELQAFGGCMARTQKRAALALIATEPGSREEQKMLQRLVYGEQTICLSGGTEMLLPGVFARGAVAEGLVRAGGVPEGYALPVPAPSEVRDLHGAARCYTASHRGEVEKLLETGPASREEVAAVRGIWNDFKACMPNLQVRLNAPWIRFLLAEALLRVPAAAAPAAK